MTPKGTDVSKEPEVGVYRQFSISKYQNSLTVCNRRNGKR